ncbi:hypothetical protein [uncultured Draconibacterium sp.]|uniref:hypothetical protein n=1 Tax=uncultured Draconibacterium sp. TaxID=1573823 RepID=UPI0025D6B4C3|nr:hypothetical protein [uncultured Draconibacterium sp.]
MKTKAQKPEAAEAVAPEKKEFEPRLIGDPDFKRLHEINVAYEKLFRSAEKLKQQLELCLKREQVYSFSEFVEFLKSDAKKWIYSKHIEYNNLNYPGINLEQLIELKAITIEGINEVLAARSNFEEIKTAVKNLKFHFPIAKLWNEEEQEFIENQEFWESSEIFCSRFTRSEDQNRILSKIENLKDALNELVEEGLLRTNNGPTELNFISEWLTIPIRSNESGFSVDRVLFWKQRTRKFKIAGIEQHWQTDPEILLSV